MGGIPGPGGMGGCAIAIGAVAQPARREAAIRVGARRVIVGTFLVVIVHLVAGSIADV